MPGCGAMVISYGSTLVMEWSAQVEGVKVVSLLLHILCLIVFTLGAVLYGLQHDTLLTSIWSVGAAVWVVSIIFKVFSLS